MPVSWKHYRSPYIDRDHLIPVVLRPMALGRSNVSPARRLLLVLIAVVSLTLVMMQQVSNASTQHNYNSASDYLTWLLRGEALREENKAARSVPGSALLTSLPRTTGTEGRPALKMDLGITHAVIEQVQSDDTLFSILQRHGVERKTALDAAREGNAVAKRYGVGHLMRPFPLGKLLKLTFDQNNHLASLSCAMDETRTLHVARRENGALVTEIQKVPPPGAKGKESALPVVQLASTATQAMPLHVRDLFSGSPRQVRDRVQPDDLLTTLLARHGINQATAYQVAEASRPAFNLARMMKPGNEVRLSMDHKGQLLGVAYSMDPDTLLWIMRPRDGAPFQPHVQKKQFDTQLRQVSGTIGEEGSLFLAGQSAGLSHAMVSKLANLFEWDIDFTRDIHAGDRFRVVYETKYYHGRRERDGEIVAAEFINQGRLLQVFHYTDPAGNTGYYDAKGQSIRKLFIRAPVDFTRISSLFSRNRPHPIFGFTRAHKGVDYAAPQGTPVRAAGDGRITFIGRKGEYGQFITIRHNDTYSTAYAHLSAFGHGLQVGSRIKQGEMIGRVGATGSATGPHLHYEVRVHEAQVNPLSIQQVTANPILVKYADDFRLQTGRVLALLHTEETTRVAALPKSDDTDD